MDGHSDGASLAFELDAAAQFVLCRVEMETLTFNAVSIRDENPFVVVISHEETDGTTFRLLNYRKQLNIVVSQPVNISFPKQCFVLVSLLIRLSPTQQCIGGIR